ncbi:MAG TPA: inorganic diphosphatase [Candidatus Limnocylindrales bacterium]|jgi:inorganic pyrophosphatase
MTRLDRIDPFGDDGHVRAVIETPQGSRHKLKYEPTDQGFAIAATMPAGMSFPFDFGFFPRTKADDGDPLDVLVLMDGPAYPGTIVEARLLGVIEADQTEQDGTAVRNDRLVAVARGSTERGDLRSLKDVDPGLVSQLESFFETYNRFDGKGFRPRKVHGPIRARHLLDAALLRRPKRIRRSSSTRP